MRKFMSDKIIYTNKDKFFDSLMQPDLTAFHRQEDCKQTSTDKKENIYFPRFAFLKISKNSSSTFACANARADARAGKRAAMYNITSLLTSNINEMKLKKINYSELNDRQKETYNFQKVSSILSDYGFATIKLNDDWQNADFIAQHIDGITFLKVQLKSRLTLDKKYKNKNIHICFPNKETWYLYDHDELLEIFLQKYSNKMAESKSWKERGGYSWPSLSKTHLLILEKYKL